MPIKRSHLVTLVILLCVLACAALITYYVYQLPNDASDSDARSTLAAGNAETFIDLAGNSTSFDAYEGTVRVVNSWASGSPYAAQELPLLEQLAEEFKDQGVVVIAINRKEPKEQAKRFLDSLEEFEYLTFAIDQDDVFYDSTDGFSMPETIFYDARGNIVAHKRGALTLEEMRTYTRAALDAAK